MGVVLVAYERESEQSAIEQLLAGRGHRVVKAANGLAALDAARRDPPHLVVSDIVLPRMDGFALCRKWKQDERLQSIPFIFYTRRHDDPKYERFALELGAERFLARAVQPDALLSAIDELLVNVPKETETTPMPALDEATVQHARALERAQQTQALAIERAQQAQSRLRAQLAELEATNQRLAAGEARFRRVFEANPLPMWITDHATGGFIAVNDAALSMYGYGRAEFLSLKSLALVSQDAAVAADVVQHRCKDGTTLSLSTAANEIEFDGRSADLICAYDLTARLAETDRLQQDGVELRERLQQEAAQLQQQLQQSSVELQHETRRLQADAAATRAVMDAAADGCWVLDADGRILEANPAYCRMSGYDRATLLKMTAADLEQQGSGEVTARLQLQRPADGGRYETRHKRQDGSLLDVEVSVGKLEDKSDNARGDSVVLIRDISQRRRELVAQRVWQRQQDFLIDLFRQAESLDESAIVRRVIEQAVEITNSPLAYLFFVEPTHKTLTLAAWRERSRPHTTMASAEPRPLAKSGLLSECVRARHPTSSNDLAWKPQTDGLPDLQRYLAVPMIAGEETVAVLGVANRDAGYGEDDQRALASLADGGWRVLQSKRAHAMTLSALQRSDVAMQGMIDALLRMSEMHDPYTAGSARRIAALAVALGREAGLDGERQHALRVAALLHDVGNVAVPSTVLTKPGRLTDAETALMRMHVEEGCKLLADVNFGAPVAEIVFEHHERCDGSGYPRGLKGEEILLEARILAIADVIEAMCSPRPHRPAAGMEEAIGEINRGAGVLYDLHLATACTRLVRQHGFTLPE
ncbi:MAG TPA: HD domain-containing phosphohydrolase [Steroidobacteraceae bacterium]|jgi:PAS domain S-box-containing protein